MVKLEDRLLYLNSPKVYAAVHTIMTIAVANSKGPLDHERLKEDLIEFFGNYERMMKNDVDGGPVGPRAPTEVK